jgi:hypothetical protein
LTYAELTCEPNKLRVARPVIQTDCPKLVMSTANLGRCARTAEGKTLKNTQPIVFSTSRECHSNLLRSWIAKSNLQGIDQAPQGMQKRCQQLIGLS